MKTHTNEDTHIHIGVNTELNISKVYNWLLIATKMLWWARARARLQYIYINCNNGNRMKDFLSQIFVVLTAIASAINLI